MRKENGGAGRDKKIVKTGKTTTTATTTIKTLEIQPSRRN